MNRDVAAAFETAAKELERFRTESNLEAVNRCVHLIADVLARRGRVFVCGNGGSMCDAMHFAEEFSGRFRDDREPYPVIALSDPAHLTCVANDYGFEYVFSRQVEALGHQGDALVVLSTSGNSPNLIRAVEAARKRDLAVIAFLGKDGGVLKGVADIEVHVASQESERIQELHMLALHTIVHCVEEKLRGSQA